MISNGRGGIDINCKVSNSVSDVTSKWPIETTIENRRPTVINLSSKKRKDNDAEDGNVTSDERRKVTEP